MQDRYAGDVGDFVKLGLLRAISRGRRLGVAWYRYPDEARNGDCRHVGYLSRRDYRALDPPLFEQLRDVAVPSRRIASLLPVLDDAVSFDECLGMVAIAPRLRPEWREAWFSRAMEALKGCDIVFADPDNGIVDDAGRRRRARTFGKQIPLAEVTALAKGRCAVIYHHNTRRAGGHDAKVGHWLAQFGVPAMAVRAKAYSCRTFFILNPDPEIAARAQAYCENWKGLRVSMHSGSR